MSSSSTSTVLHSRKAVQPAQLTPVRADMLRSRQSDSTSHPTFQRYRISTLATVFAGLLLITWAVSTLLLPTAWINGGLVLTVMLGVNVVLFQLSSWLNVWANNVQQPIAFCPKCSGRSLSRHRRSSIQRFASRVMKKRLRAVKCIQCGWRGMSGVHSR